MTWATLFMYFSAKLLQAYLPENVVLPGLEHFVQVDHSRRSKYLPLLLLFLEGFLFEGFASEEILPIRDACLGVEPEYIVDLGL
jgi:hypothetical protein